MGWNDNYLGRRCGCTDRDSEPFAGEDTMRTQSFRLIGSCLIVWGSIGLACSSTTSPQGGTGGSTSSSKGGSTTGGATGTGGIGAGGTSAAAGSSGKAGGTTGQAGGATSAGGQSSVGGQSGTGGQAGHGTGGSVQAGGATGAGGQVPLGTGGTSQAGATGTSSPLDAGLTSSCVPTKEWGTADPSNAGPFEVVADKNVGPAAGVADALHNNTIPHFNVYRPKDLTQGYCHPIITWGNGTGDQPEPDGVSCLAGQCGHYLVLLDQLASHGFVVVASLSSQTAQGNPIPQVAGVDWMIQQNDDPTSPYYHHLDTTHIGATGHSQGGAATTMAGADPRITAIAPIAGARATTLHGPAALLCGGQDTTVPCSSVQPAFDADNNLPVMMGDNLAATHGSWIGSIKDPYMIAVTGWMRVHLMGDTANRNMFYGASCKLCTDTQHWKIQRKMMDQ
jgi:hypothetical protein